MRGHSLQDDYKILCDSGCRDYTRDNWESEECITGESATNAVVAKKGFTDSDVGKAAVQSLLSGGSVKVAGVWVCVHGWAQAAAASSHAGPMCMGCEPEEAHSCSASSKCISTMPLTPRGLTSLPPPACAMRLTFAAKAINGNRNFFWGMSTTSVKDVEGQTFNNDFFQAYENFKEIRNSDVSAVC